MRLLAVAWFAGLALTGCGMRAPQPESSAGATAAEQSRQARSRFHLLLRLGERRLYLMEGDPGTPIGSFPIAVGRKGLETPTGRFQVEEMVEHPEYLRFDKSQDPPQVVATVPPGPNNPLGERWIGFAHGEGWTVGIHGTPHPELLGRAVSHGCVRMRNADVIHVYEHVQLGTPVTVVP